jgi:hypothetical protein
MNGRPVLELCKVDLVYGASWVRADQIVFAQQSGGLWQASAAGGASTAVTKLDDDRVKSIIGCLSSSRMETPCCSLDR